MIATLEGKNHVLSSDLTQSQAHVRRLEKQIANSQSQEIEIEKKLKASQRELNATRKMEKEAWNATQRTRTNIIDGIDEALLMNPNHFNDVDMLMHKDRRVTVAGRKGAI